jgi:hypothetical protein
VLNQSNFSQQCISGKQRVVIGGTVPTGYKPGRASYYEDVLNAMNKEPVVSLKNADIGDFNRTRNLASNRNNIPRPDGGKHTLAQNSQAQEAMRAQQLCGHILSEVIHRLRRGCHEGFRYELLRLKRH